MTTSALSDDELIHLIKKDDKAAFAEIYFRYAGALAAFANSKLFDMEDARDLLHDLFVSLWEKRQTLNISSSLEAYLFASTRYKIVDKIRKNSTRQQYKMMLQALPEQQAENIEKLGEAKELELQVVRSLEKLPARTKEIYKMSREQFLSIQEIAKLLNLSEQTVKNQLTIALKHLRQSIPGMTLLAVLLDLLKK